MTDQESGKLIATVEQIASMLKETRDDVKDIVKCQSKTEERLSHGAGHFAKLDEKVNQHEVVLQSKADSKTVFTCIGLGFTILCALIVIFKFWGGN